MVKYELSHLTQDDSQNVWGPIQDDEALLLYSIIRCSRLTRIFEIGGLNGYSATNFLQATSFSNDSVVYTCDINPVQKLADNHIVLTKNVLDVTADDVGNKPLDLIFFDCHDMLQMQMYINFITLGLINDNTIIALHDTNLHYAPYNRWGGFVPIENGFAHQPVERIMVNIFKDLGYHVYSVRTDAAKHSESFPIRHGISICQKFKQLHVQ